MKKKKERKNEKEVTITSIQKTKETTTKETNKQITQEYGLDLSTKMI